MDAAVSGVGGRPASGGRWPAEGRATAEGQAGANGQAAASRRARGRLLGGRAWKLWLAPALFTVASGLAVVRLAGSASVLRHTSIDWTYLAAAAAIYPLFAALRGVRFRLLMAGQLSWRETVGVGWLSSAACSILPGGLGEASLPALYGSVAGGAADATAAIVTTRVQDLLSWLVVLVAGGFLAGRLLPAAAMPLLALALLITAGGTLVAFSGSFRRFAFRLAAPLPAVAFFLEELDGRLGPMGGNWPSWGVTLALRLASTFKYYFALRAFGAPVTPAMAAVGGALLALMLVIPIQGVAGLGTVELWWIAALALFAIPGPVAAVAALGTHVLLLVVSMACGGIALAWAPAGSLQRKAVA